jgi:RNA polymerase sigma factor (TIGR02999 family)
MEFEPSEITGLLHDMRNGGPEAEERLIAVVYKELRRLAASYLRQEAAGHTLQPTALVHEAYLRLTHMEAVDWESRSHFFAVAARLMRHILVDHARAQLAEKRGERFTIVGLDEALVASPDKAPEILALDEALDRLARFDPRQCRIVELRFFSGMNEEETGRVLGISSRTVKRDWRAAKAWLYRELNTNASAGLPDSFREGH